MRGIQPPKIPPPVAVLLIADHHGFEFHLRVVDCSETQYYPGSFKMTDRLMASLEDVRRHRQRLLKLGITGACYPKGHIVYRKEL